MLWHAFRCMYIYCAFQTTSAHVCLDRSEFITETKAPVVAVFFLNDWGERQVIPYQLKRTNLAKTPDHHTAHKTFDKVKGKQTSHTLEHYAIIVSEDKLRSFGFPGLTKIGVCSPPLLVGSAILQSEYFTCNGGF